MRLPRLPRWILFVVLGPALVLMAWIGILLICAPEGKRQTTNKQQHTHTKTPREARKE